MDTRLGVAGRGESISNVWAPADNFLILVVVQNCGNLCWPSVQGFESGEGVFVNEPFVSFGCLRQAIP